MINKAILYMLKNSAELTAITTAIYPVIMPEETQAPCAVFMRDSISPEYDKGNVVTDVNEVSVIAFSKDYVQSVDMAIAVRDAIENKKGTYNGVDVTTARLRSGQEGYDVDSDTFFQKLSFTIKSQK